MTTGPTTLDGSLSLAVAAGAVVPQAGLLVVSVTGELIGEFATVQGLETLGAGTEVVYAPEGVRVMAGPTP